MQIKEGSLGLLDSVGEMPDTDPILVLALVINEFTSRSLCWESACSWLADGGENGLMPAPELCCLLSLSVTKNEKKKLNTTNFFNIHMLEMWKPSM